MSDGRKGRVKIILVMSFFLAMVILGYYWPFQIHLDDIRKQLPGFVDSQVQSVLDKMPPDKTKNLSVPLPEIKYECDFYYDPVVSRGEFNATYWIANNTKKSDKFVADIFAAELIMGMTTRVSTTGGDWANAPDPISMMSHTDEFFKTDNASRADELAHIEKADYAFVPQRGMYTGWWLPQESINYTKFDDTRYFQNVYAGENVTIYRVL